MNVVEAVLELPITETVRLDVDRLGTLVAYMPAPDAGEMIQRAVHELAHRISRCVVHYSSGDLDRLRDLVKTLVGIADQIGMSTLSRVALQVVECIDAGDQTATAATFARFVRIGDISLCAIWDVESAMSGLMRI